MNVARVFRTLFRRAEVEREIDTELRMHLELEADDLTSRGASAAQARRQAAMTFGGVQQTREDAVKSFLPGWWVNLSRDARIAMRSLNRQRTFTLTAILAMSLAIAVNTSMYSIVDAMINPDGGPHEPNRLFELKYFGDPRKKVDFAERERATSATMDSHGGYTEWAYGETGSIERKVRADFASSARVRPNFFTMLGVAPVQGSLIPPADMGSAQRSAVISTKLRALLFTTNESPLGQSIFLSGVAYNVIGVVERFERIDPMRRDVWTFSRPDEALSFKIIRLKDNESLPQTQKRLELAAARMALAAGEERKNSGFVLKPFATQFRVGGFQYALVGAGIAILLVACTNLANLQLARGLTRGGELAVRSALGASRKQIIVQLVLESAVLAIGALILAIGLAMAGNSLITAYIPPRFGEYVAEPHANWRTLVAASAATIVCLFFVGLLPAVRVSRVQLNTLLKGRAGTGAHKSNRRIYGTLVVAQIALTLPLICAAVFLSISAWHASDTDYLIRNELGYDPRQLIRVSIPTPKDSTRSSISYLDKSAELVARAHAVSGVEFAAVAYWWGAWTGTITLQGDAAPVEVHPVTGAYQVVGPEYNRVMGFPITRGHDFSESASTSSAVLIDSQTARVLWPDRDAMGRWLRLGDMRSAAPTLTVAGMLQDLLTDEAREERRLRLGGMRLGMIERAITPADSLKLGKYSIPITLNVRVKGDPAVVRERLRQAFTDDIHRPPLVILETTYLGLPDRAIVFRFVAGLFCVFALIGLGLSALGVYAIVAQSVTDRRREVAVRIAIGASPQKIIYSLLREGNVLVLAGVAIGLLLTTFTMGWLGIFMYNADTANPFSFAALCVLLFAAMVISALAPAVKATQLDPMDVLRAE